MQGTIVNFRRGRKTQRTNHMVILVDKVDKKEKAEKLVGKTVVWTNNKTDIKGKVAATHGNSGAVRAIFERGMPGQAIGTKVKIE